MKHFTRFVCFLLVMSLLLVTPVSATEETVLTPSSARTSSYFLSYSVYLHRTSDTTFEVWFDVVGTYIMQEIGATVIKVQRSADGENWTTMLTYRVANHPGMICENTVGHSYGVSYNVGTSGYYYRAYVVLYAKNSSGFGEMYKYTSKMLL